MEPTSFQLGRGQRKRVIPARYSPSESIVEAPVAGKKGTKRRISSESTEQKTPSNRKGASRKIVSPNVTVKKKVRTMKGRRARNEKISEKPALESFVLKDFNDASDLKQVELIDNLIGQVSNLGLASSRPRNGVEWVFGGLCKTSEVPTPNGEGNVADGLKPPATEIQQLLEKEQFSSRDFFEVCKNYKLGWWGRDPEHQEAFHKCKGGKIILEHLKVDKIGMGRMGNMEINLYLGDMKKYLKSTYQVFEDRELLKLYHKDEDMKTASGKLFVKLLEKSTLQVDSESESEADDN